VSTSTYPLAAANQPPIETLTAAQNVDPGAQTSVTSTASDPDGTIASYAWTVVNVTGGAVPTLTGASTATCTFTAGAAGAVYQLTCVATDNGGASVTQTTEVRVRSTGNLVPLATAATTTGTVTRTGGSSDGGVLADNDDTTYLAITNGGSATVRCTPITTRTGMTVRFRLKSPDGGSARVSLYQGSTLIQAATGLALTTGAADYDLAISSANWATVTDPGNLSIKVEAL